MLDEKEILFLSFDLVLCYNIAYRYGTVGVPTYIYTQNDRI